MSLNPNSIEKNLNLNMSLNNFSKENISAGGYDTCNDQSLSNSEDNKQFRNGRWLPNEHMRFIKGCLLYGNNWKKVIY
jgi:hypothetical protein